MYMNKLKACLFLWLNSSYGMSPVELQLGRLEMSEQ